MSRRKKSEDPKLPKLITTEELCKVTGYTDVHHRQAAKAGYFPPPSNGLYKAIPTLQGLFKRERDLRTNSTQPYATERQAKIKAQRELLDMQVARARGDSLPVDSVQKGWSDMVLTIRQQVMNLPSRLAPKLPFCKSQAEMELEIKSEVERILTELSHADPTGQTQTV